MYIYIDMLTHINGYDTVYFNLACFTEWYWNFSHMYSMTKIEHIRTPTIHTQHTWTWVDISSDAMNDVISYCETYHLVTLR